MESPTVRYMSECFIKPRRKPEGSEKPYYLSPWDLVLLSMHYNQKGLLFAKPPRADQRQDFMKDLMEKMKESLSVALIHFYPLAGRLATLKEESPSAYSVFIDCNNSPGARFICAALDMTVSDILSPTHVPQIVKSFFDLNGAVNHDGHTRPLLTIQVTELVDGVFVGATMNHCLADGTSLWNFFNSWSEIFRQAQVGSENVQISQPPVLKPWFPDGHGPIVNLPYKHPAEFISISESPQLKERVFHFSSESMARLKERANKESNTDKISSFQALLALLWRCITRARNLPHHQIVSCSLAADNRSRLQPPLSPTYFGNPLSIARGVATAGELMERNLGWAAWKLHQAVTNITNAGIRGWLEEWLSSPHVYQMRRFGDPADMRVGSSHRFNMYETEFGMGKALAVRSGCANKFDGKTVAYPGREGRGTVDLEVCLLPEFMEAIESDEELMSVAS